MSNSQVKPKAFFNSCITIVSKYVMCHDPLEFKMIDLANGVYTLCNSISPIEMEGAPHFYILTVKNSKGLYLHISATLKAPRNGASKETNHAFEGISVQFLHGTGKCFCRAEWDVKVNRQILVHPQPHWHFGIENEDTESLSFDTEEDSNDSYSGFLEECKELEPSLPDIDFEQLHYAMAAKWASQDNAIEDFSIQRLYKWLEHCIINVIDQYNYQVNKGSFESAKRW